MAAKSETGHASIASALAAVQAEIPEVSKGNTAEVTTAKGSYSYTYADLAVITPKILPLLGRNGLAFTARPTLVGDAFVLHYALAHAASDEVIEGSYPLPDPLTSKPQEIGSAITYARRYALCAVTGVAPGGDDDDAAAANGKPAASRKPRQPATPKQKPIAAPEAASEGYAGRILDVNTVEELRAVHEDAEQAGELGLVFSGAEKERTHLAKVVEVFELAEPPADVKVGQVIGAVKRALEQRAMIAQAEMEAADEDGEWPVAQIPDGGDPS
jgi:hypothetical protein